MPIVSVVIPVCEDADALPRAVESVRSQTLTDVEVLVVEDGPEGAAAAYVESTADDRVHHVRQGANRGASAARNAGIERAEGRYVAFLDPADEWHPEKLERQVVELETRSPEWVAAYCGVESVFPGDATALEVALAGLLPRRRDAEGAEGGEKLIGDVLADDLHTHAESTLLVGRAVAERIGGFDASFRHFQGSEFVLRLLREGKLAPVDRTLVRRHVAAQPPADAVREADERLLETFSETVARLEASGRNVTGARHSVLATRYLREGDFRTGARYLASAGRPALRQFPGLFRVVCSGLARRVRPGHPGTHG